MAAAMAQPDAARAQQHMPQPDAPLTLEALRASPLGMLLEAAIAPLGVAGGAVDMKNAWQNKSPLGGILGALAMLPGPAVPGGGKAAKAVEGIPEIGRYMGAGKPATTAAAENVTSRLAVTLERIRGARERVNRAKAFNVEPDPADVAVLKQIQDSFMHLFNKKPTKLKLVGDK